MSHAPVEGDDPTISAQDIAALIPIVQRVVAARVGGHPFAEDLVQETLTRVLAASASIEPATLEPYAIVTAKNLVASMWRDEDRRRRNQPRLADARQPERPEESILERESHDAVLEALGRLDEREREALLAHEVAGQPTRLLADRHGTTPGAVAAQLNRTRARMRVEYILALASDEPPTDRCRAVLLSLSSGDRRRQREVQAGRHLLECDFCATQSDRLMERAQQHDDEVRIPIRHDSDIVAARQAAREVAQRAGFDGTDLTVIATAVSEVSRNIVRFAGSGEVVVTLVESPRTGIRIAALDAGPGIEDIERAMADGFSSYGGLGLGLAGARRLMDEFALVSEPGHGTTVTLIKWRQEKADGP